MTFSKNKLLMLLIIFSLVLVTNPINDANASPKLDKAQREVDRLRTEAATKFEAANEANLRIKNLQPETEALSYANRKVQIEMQNSSKLLSQIAIANYKKGSLGSSIDLLLSTDPKRYLSDMSTLELVYLNYERQLRRFRALSQQNEATKLVIADRMKILELERIKLNAEVAAAKLALAKAEKVLKTLKVSDRQKLVSLESAREERILKNSRKLAAGVSSDGSRGSIALRYALDQIGDIYVWAAAGPTKWDCSGLTMRSFQKAGISLPHSAAMQFKYGKSVSFNQVKPGDLLFFGKPISHVSIYMGKGKMVQAPRPGKKVEVVDFPRMFGYKPFIGAKRL